MKKKSLRLIMITGLFLFSQIALLTVGCGRNEATSGADSTGISSASFSGAASADSGILPSSSDSEDLPSGGASSAVPTGASGSSSAQSATSSPSSQPPSQTSSAVSSQSSSGSVQGPAAGAVTPVTLPSDQVGTISALGFTEAGYLAKAAQPASYAGNAGWDVSSIVLSPYYTLTVNGTAVPVYASPVYVANTNSGALQSFAMIDVPEGDFYLDVQLDVKGVSFDRAAVLPESLGVEARASAGKSISARLTDHGIYTFLTGSGSGLLSQQYAIVLMVREYKDENAEIAAYKAQYGEDHVMVFEPGTHFIDYLNITQSDYVIYLKRGSLLVVNHQFDIDSDSDNTGKAETGALAASGIGLNRYPVICFRNRSNVRVVGRGTIDGGRLDWHERRGLVFSACSDVTVDGINIVNLPEWGFISYCSSNVNVKNVMLLGWKTNSDAFALCNTTGSAVSNCFARTGDDMFEVKTLGASYNAVTENVTFTDCYAWGSKARAFGITGEVSKDIRNVAFRDCAVLYRDAIWDNNRLGSLAIIVEGGPGNITGITFENIEIYYDYGRAINNSVLSSGSPANQITGIVYKNVAYAAGMKCQIRTQAIGTSRIEVLFKNVRSDGSLITQANAAADVLLSGANSILAVEN